MRTNLRVAVFILQIAWNILKQTKMEKKREKKGRRENVKKETCNVSARYFRVRMLRRQKCVSG